MVCSAGLADSEQFSGQGTGVKVMSYAAVIESRRAVEDRFKYLEEGLQKAEQRKRDQQAAQQQAAQQQADAAAHDAPQNGEQ